MAGVRALAAQGEQVEDSEAIVTSALGYQVWCSLPDVSSDGATTTQKYGDVKSFRAGSSGPIEVRDHMGRRVCIVPPFGTLVVKARNNDSESLPSWEVFGPGYKQGGQKAVHLADLAVTNLATAVGASAAAFSASYVEATIEGEADSAIDTVAAALVVLATASFQEVEEKVNAIIAQLDLMGLTGDISIAEGTDTLALSSANPGTWQLVDDSETLVTNANAFPVYCTLPDVSSDGATTTVPLKHIVKFKNTGGGPIVVRDFDHRFVCIVPDEVNKIVRAVSATDGENKWQVLDDMDSELTLAPTRVAQIAPLSITAITPAASAIDLAAAYADLDWDTETDVAIDAVMDSIDTDTAAAFAQIEVTVNAILVAIETITLTAAV
jgi:hypothetical protein